MILIKQVCPCGTSLKWTNVRTWRPGGGKQLFLGIKKSRLIVSRQTTCMGWLSLHKELAFLINAACGATFWTEQCCSGLHQKEFLQTRKALAQVVTRETSMTCRYRLWTVKIKGLSGWFQIHNWWEQDYEVQISAFHKEDESGSFTPGVCTLISGRGRVWGHFQLR